MTYRYISNFARTQGAKDKQERKRRNVGGYAAGAGAAGLAGAGGIYGANKVMMSKGLRRGALAAGILGGVGAAGLGYKAYTNRKENKRRDGIDARNKSAYEGSVKGRSEAAVAALKQKAGDIRSGAASRYQSAKSNVSSKYQSAKAGAKALPGRVRQGAKDGYNRAFPKYESY